MKCQQCDRPAMYVVSHGDPSVRVPMCLQCYQIADEIAGRQFERHAAMYNVMAAQLDNASFGLGPPTPRIPLPERSVISHEGVALNNIRIEGGTIGVLNTGTIASLRNVDVSVGTLAHQGEAELAGALRAVAEAVAASDEVAEEQREAILESLALIATEAVAEPQQRRTRAVRTLIVDMSSIMSGVSGLSQIWERYGSVITASFGLALQ